MPMHLSPSPSPPLSLPPEASVLERLRPAFTAPTYERLLVLCVGAIVAMGRRTVSRVLWSVRCLVRGHPSSYHRFFSRARWPMLPLAKVLAAMALELVPEGEAVEVVADDTVDGCDGDHAYGTGCHRDAVRSSRSRTVFKFGHKWASLAVRVPLPLCKRRWALPLLSALCLPRPGDKKDQEAEGAEGPEGAEGAEGRGQKPGKKRGKKQRLTSELRKRDAAGVLPPRHKTPPLLARQMLAVLMHWFPQRRFVLLGDWGFACHDLAWFCHRHRRRVTLVGRARSDLSLYALPPRRRPYRRGRPPLKGRKLPTPAQSVAAADPACRRHATVSWYGDSTHELELLGGCGGWYRHRGSGRAALVPLRWVWARDPKSGREDYFYSTDPSLPPERLLGLFCGRWSIEVTFEEVRAHLGFETTRHWCRQSVLRVAPCLLALFTVVSLIYAEIARRRDVKVHRTPCYRKAEPTFADALAAVRRLLWEQVILPHLPGGGLVAKLPAATREVLLEHLTAAA
jgi:hypothetical protein